MDKIKLPPAGVKPAFAARADRAKDIVEAILQYVWEDCEFPQEWLDELAEINAKAATRKPLFPGDSNGERTP